jgi:hypothetical protein
MLTTRWAQCNDNQWSVHGVGDSVGSRNVMCNKYNTPQAMGQQMHNAMKSYWAISRVNKG